MAIITEDYISFETAKLLKEKEFDEKCQKVYLHNGQLLWAQLFMEGESLVDNNCVENVAWYKGWITYTQGEYAYLCPTLQMAMKWLREVHSLHIWIGHADGKVLPWYYEIHGMSDGKVKHIGGIQCGSYEVTCESAIKYCLESLI